MTLSRVAGKIAAALLVSAAFAASADATDPWWVKDGATWTQAYIAETDGTRLHVDVLGPDGKPVPVRPWQPRTAEERRRHLAAERRSRLRREINRVGTEIKQTSYDDEQTGRG